ncbi:metal ABC transporter substrate-binding protein [Lysinibacter sp. HNR]|uniref:metal ABC transporter substrate-binding protein n=1 Tax=Lysinibacter sp. HNR TaxID=3031408 RepID=UPI002434D7F1|nr:metal ABC transporter substrate-binding protein [Lysinibacter sp. HNR]WGD37239.1 metal ABC transporter substrate-binding protein [Lysinibacter sp. HNR]
MTRFTPHRLIAPLAVAIAATLAVAGCAPSSSSNSVDGALNVVATTTQITDFAQNVGEDRINLTSLFAPGDSAHHFDPTPADLATLGSADVLILNGAGLESFLDSAIEASGFSGLKIDTSVGITLSGGDHDHADDADHDDTDHAGHDHADHAHAEPDGHAKGDATQGQAANDHSDHDHSEGNPHTWTSPANAKIMVQNIANGLAEASPDNSAFFTGNAQAYESKLDQLSQWVQENVATVPAEKRLVVSGHDSLHYFFEHYDITFVGAIIPSFEDNAEPSAAEIDSLVAKIQELGVTTIFSESSVNSRAASAIAQAAGVAVRSGEDALFADSLGTAGSAGETYIQATIHNTTVILESWGVSPTPVPVALESTM